MSKNKLSKSVLICVTLGWNISFSFARLNVKCPIFAYHGKIWVTYIGMRFCFAYYATFCDLSSRKLAWKTIYDWLWRGSTDAITPLATEIFPIESYLHLSSTWWPLFRIVGTDLYIRIIRENCWFTYSFSKRTGRVVCADACFLLQDFDLKCVPQTEP